MALNIKDSTADKLARRLAKLTGESLTDAVIAALEERLARIDRSRGSDMLENLRECRQRFAKLKVLDTRSADEILGFGANGLPS